MPSGFVSLAIAIISLLVAILTFTLKDVKTRWRYIFGSIFLLLTLYVGYEGLSKLQDEKKNDGTTEVIVVTATSNVVVEKQTSTKSTTVPPTISSQNSTPASFSPTTVSPLYRGWLICWHGKFSHEYLIAYPEADVLKGLRLDILLIKPWDNQNEYLPNDSIKECLYNGAWYGQQNPPWFPLASFLKLEGGNISICENGLNGCNGQKWAMDKAGNAPKVIEDLLHQPKEVEGIQVLGEIPSNVLWGSQ
jgi:hypothetical protein